MKRNHWEHTAHFLFDFKQRRFRYIKTNNSCRPKASDLTAEFGTDGSSGAGNEDDFACERGADLILFQANRSPAQKILDCDFADLSSQTATLDHFAQPGNSLD